MFETALLPVTLREPVSKISDMISFLQFFDTRKVLLYHVAAGPVNSAIERRLEKWKFEILEKTSEADLQRDEASQLEIECRVRSGSPAYEIATGAEEELADFIYFPWKRKSWIQRTLVGSTTKDVIRISNRPIFIFKQRRIKKEREDFKVMYPTNFRGTDRFVLPYLGYPGLAAHELILINVRDRAPDPSAESREQRSVENNLNRLGEKVTNNYDMVTPMRVIGHPRRDITRVARRQNIDFLILGKSDKQSAFSSMMGSVAEEVAYNAPCSVFIVGRGQNPEEVKHD